MKLGTPSNLSASYGPDANLTKQGELQFADQSAYFTIHRHIGTGSQQMVQMAFCDLSHTFHKQVTNVSQHVFVIVLRGILTSPLSCLEQETKNPTCELWFRGEVGAGESSKDVSLRVPDQEHTGALLGDLFDHGGEALSMYTVTEEQPPGWPAVRRQGIGQQH